MFTHKVTEPIGVAVIGAGWMGSLHANVYASSPLWELRAVVDPVQERAELLARRYGADFYVNDEDVLRREDIQAVSVCTPDHLHVEPVCRALLCGKHVLVEKPLATDIGHAQNMVNLARSSGVILMVGYTRRFDPRYVQAKDVVSSGEIGKVVHLWARRNARITSPRRIGGRTSPLYYLAIHDINMMRWLCGSRIIRVSAEATSGVLNDLGVVDSLQAIFRFENGAIGGLEVAWILPENYPSIADAKLEVLGTLGVIYVDEQHEGVMKASRTGLLCPSTVLYPEVKGSVGGALALEIEHFRLCIVSGCKPDTDAEDAVEDIRVIEAIERAVSAGRTVEV